MPEHDSIKKKLIFRGGLAPEEEIDLTKFPALACFAIASVITFPVCIIISAFIVIEFLIGAAKDNFVSRLKL